MKFRQRWESIRESEHPGPVKQKISNLERKVVFQLRKIRIEKNITVSELAEETGLEEALIEDIEARQLAPRIDHLMLLAGCLEVDLAALVKSAESGGSPPHLGNSPGDPSEG